MRAKLGVAVLVIILVLTILLLLFVVLLNHQAHLEHFQVIGHALRKHLAARKVVTYKPFFPQQHLHNQTSLKG
jgi:hypothetical protein